jgi:hypothetical protein
MNDMGERVVIVPRRLNNRPAIVIRTILRPSGRYPWRAVWEPLADDEVEHLVTVIPDRDPKTIRQPPSASCVTTIGKAMPGTYGMVGLTVLRAGQTVGDWNAATRAARGSTYRRYC